MYNFRYLLVTIVSIFVSLAIGLLLGAAIAGSDLARDASRDMMGSLMTRLDEINATNSDLRRQLDDDNLLAGQLIDDWAGKRLDGRTICVIGSAEETDVAMAESLRAALIRAGGATVYVKVLKDGFGLSDAQHKADLEKLVPAVPDEDYALTIAHALAGEWTYAYAATALDAPSAADETVGSLPRSSVGSPSGALSGAASDSAAAPEVAPGSASSAASDAADSGSASSAASDAADSGSASSADSDSSSATTNPALPSPFQSTIYSHYRLTTYLVEQGIIQVNTDYHLLSEHQNPQLQNEQLAALRVTGSWQLPYAVNGVINTLVTSTQNPASAAAPKTDTAPEAGPAPDAPLASTIYHVDPVAIALTSAFVSKGVEKTLPFPASLRPTSVDDEAVAEDASYFGLLAQSGDKAQPLATTARDHNLAALVSVEGEVDVYNVVALLSGAKRGIYGLDASDGRFPALPADPGGRLPFAR